MMKKPYLFFTCICCVFSLSINLFSTKAIHIHNTLKQINECQGKLKLKLIRVWNDDEKETDEQKFFKTPTDVITDKNDNLYILERANHRVKVFNNERKLIRTIGRKGKGPGDLFLPNSIAIDKQGNLIVDENYRIHVFDPNGNYQCIHKLKHLTRQIGVTSQGDYAVSSTFETHESRTLISLYSRSGIFERAIGKLHGNSNNWQEDDKIRFVLDESDNFYISNIRKPVIRKYSFKGYLLCVITYEIPFVLNLPEITLNPTKDEIMFKGDFKEKIDVKQRSGSGGTMIQATGEVVNLASDIGIDNHGRIFLVSKKRRMTEEEVKNRGVLYSSSSGIIRDNMNLDLFQNIDLFRILVFNKSGKIIATAQLHSLCDGIWIHNNKLFVLDGTYTQRMFEYEMTFFE